MKSQRWFLIAAVLIFLFSIIVSAHPGDTDYKGGHKDHSSGDYHYHHGYPEHEHTDLDGDGHLDCPYDSDYHTDHSSGSNSAQGASASDSHEQDASKRFPTFGQLVTGYIACAFLFTISAIFSDYLYDTNPYGLYSLFEGIPFVLYILSFPLSELFRRLAKSFLTAIKK